MPGPERVPLDPARRAPSRRRSRAWFHHQVAALAALVRTFPRPRQRAVLEQLEELEPRDAPEEPPAREP